MFNGFEPIFNCESRVLILGSFPGKISRHADFYYANPSNRLWGMLENVFKESVGENKESKTQFLLNHKIALWDIVPKRSEDKSSDSDLEDNEAVDLYRILNFADIKKILCNGKKSYECLHKHYPELLVMTEFMYSTSPASTKFYDLKQWKEELLFLT